MKVRIYTDGSFSNNYNIGSWAIVICEERKIRTYSGIVRNGSNNQMELKAINEALAFSFLKNYNDVEIFTDSAYVINNIERQTYKEWEVNNWKNVKGENIKNYKEWMEFIKYKIIFKKNNINVKFTKEYFAMFARQISEKQEDGKKKVMEKGWFQRGVKVMCTGFRREDTFVCKSYKHTPTHQLYKITSISKDGTLMEIEHERYQVGENII